ncbi:ethanolamine ammonia-lyase subunit EutC [Oceanobacter sp. 5_MG-2023]|uniref:ethanolamine ammonia-lyase subunit EutC n=1 Tax=Oceanobacter sp. 5_MG-2023 TaxID=3062645 RepID=UPI0026E24B22|nr:ethanolamine ammonia-lyase subunit EutC [Oceanobacter sp. 5_MG-2023]MDO6683428.1 ethanolamine ammonia-lyase subunit EutC [Oceanobacter sp. 5_MG-2023]
MADKPDTILVENPWQTLREYTDARIGLGRAGISLPTRAHLEFQLAHARARDAVHLPLGFVQLQQDLEQVLAQAGLPGPVLKLASQADGRPQYLQRPDYGRQLSSSSQEALTQWMADSPPAAFDIAVVVADGLSSLAVQRHAAPMLDCLLTSLADTSLKVGPVVMVEQGRVAIGDPIGETLKARMLVMLIGERPGLSSPDSLGIYFTWKPASGKHDANRNCISNVRHEGLRYEEATHKLMYLLLEADRRALSGVALKDESDNGQPSLASKSGNLLLKTPNT